MLSLKTRLECSHSYVTGDSTSLLCEFDVVCDGKLYECCLYGKSFAEEMRLIAENERGDADEMGMA